MAATDTLRGLTVIVTGAASGIGRQLARDLYWQEGANLILVDRDEPRLELLKDELAAEPGRPRVESFVCDIADPRAVRRLAQETADIPVDVLINNAGVASLGSFEKTEFEDFEEVIRVNLLGTARLTKALLPALLRSRRAFVVNVSSLAGLMGAPGLCGYAASKAGLIAFSRSLSLELEGRAGVCVVCPSFVKTAIAEHALLPVEESLRPGRVGAMNALLSAVGSNPRRVSRAVIRAVKRGERFSLVNPDAHFLYYLDRLFPALARAAVWAAYRRLAGAGVIEA